MEIRKAERKKAKLRLGIAAPSGAGKTYSALLMAFGLGGKIGLIDTEHGSGDLYAHLGDYDIISIEAPYTVKKYTEAISAFEAAYYGTIIIDSLSHAWAGDGGLLDKQGKMADRGTNSFAAWRTITPEHNNLVDAMLRSPCHVIATMRAKQEYVLETNDKGKQQPKKVGMAPVQREGMEYEFTVMLDVDMQHIASASKDRTSLFDGQFFKIDKGTGTRLLEWLDTGVIPAEPELPPEDSEAATFAESKAMEVRALMLKSDIAGAAITLNTLGTSGEYDPEAKELVCRHIESPIRSAIKAYDAITQARTLEGLKLAWGATPKHSQALLLPFKDARKVQLDASDTAYKFVGEDIAASGSRDLTAMGGIAA